VALSTWIPFGATSSTVSKVYGGRQSSIIRLDSTSSADVDSMVLVCSVFGIGNEI
jgi:hypothetical protein